MEKNRKYIVLTILVAMVAVAGYLNLSYNQTGEDYSIETQGEGNLKALSRSFPLQPRVSLRKILPVKRSGSHLRL